jgi:hypothetical protein
MEEWFEVWGLDLGLGDRFQPHFLISCCDAVAVVCWAPVVISSLQRIKLI